VAVQAFERRVKAIACTCQDQSGLPGTVAKGQAAWRPLDRHECSTHITRLASAFLAAVPKRVSCGRVPLFRCPSMQPLVNPYMGAPRQRLVVAAASWSLDMTPADQMAYF
jgi:hypothetical protein